MLVGRIGKPQREKDTQLFQWERFVMDFSEWLSIIAIVISAIAAFVAVFFEIWRNRSNLIIHGPKEFGELHACYLAPALDPSRGNVCSFAIELILENRSASPVCITTVKLLSERYGTSFPALFDRFHILQEPFAAYETFDGYEFWNLKDNSKFPLMLRPYDAQKLKVLFPIASDNFNPHDEPTYSENQVLPPEYHYSITVYTSRKHEVTLEGTAPAAKLISDPETVFEDSFGKEPDYCGEPGRG